MDLVTPNGRPIAVPTAKVSVEAAIAVAHAMIRAQLEALVALGVPPMQIVEMTTNHLTDLLSRFDPPETRNQLIRDVAESVGKDARDKARKRTIAAAIPPVQGTRS